MTSVNGQKEPRLGVTRRGAGNEQPSGRRAMFGDAAVPFEPIEQERLRGAIERARGIGRDVMQILEKFYVNGQDAIPPAATPQWLSQERMCKPPIQLLTRSIT
jgi:hypothetical protein